MYARNLASSVFSRRRSRPGNYYFPPEILILPTAYILSFLPYMLQAIKARKIKPYYGFIYTWVLKARPEYTGQ